MFKEKNLSQLVIIIPIIFILLTGIGSIYLSISILDKQFKHDVKFSEEKELSLQKQHIKNQVDNIYSYLEYKKSESSQRLRTKLKNRVLRAYELSSKIYSEKKLILSEQELRKEILETLRKIRFGSNGYYFVAEMKSNKEIISRMLPATPNAENINAYPLKDANGKYYVQEFANVVKEYKEGFVNYHWYKLNENKKQQFEKLSFVKLFEPYNWFIGYGEYLDDFDLSLKEEAKKRLDTYRFDNNGYIWTHDSKYTLIQHPYREESIGINDVGLTDKKGTKIIQLFVEKALKNKNGSFVEYYWNKPNENELTKKIGFVRYFEDWDWIIGSGVYLEDINLYLNHFKDKKKGQIQEVIQDSVIIMLIILLVVVIISIFISKKINESFFKYKKQIEDHKEFLEVKIKEKTIELSNLNNQLEEKIQKRVEEINEKDKTLVQQSKMAALGEMIGNIAHQWRQPLSAISTAASGLKLKKEMNMLSDKEIIEFSDGIVKNSQYLSQVIEDFKNFVKSEKESVEFNINSAVSNSLTIFNSSIHNHKLTIVEKLEKNIYITNYKNELIQALVNILNNAKDALKEVKKNEEDRIIIIETKKIDNKAIIIIQDAAEGINEDIINKVFEPYFTTKNKEQGTGLGLYMTYQIISDSMKGKIEVENANFVHNNIPYSGAKFIITLDN